MKKQNKILKNKGVQIFLKALFYTIYTPLWVAGAVLSLVGQILLISGEILFLDKVGAMRKIKNLKTFMI